MSEGSFNIPGPAPLPPRNEGLRSSIDDIIDLYKKDVDRSLLRENLKLSVTERILNSQAFGRFAAELHESGRRHRGEA
jgi:hypothetical protein